ncbi:hypothetical protein ABL78_0033 [Leptomonas seymouri]|uniref:Uncharacterized protein n=1 Tax=Leptomonas seymouri TaxID=5684 RepID=A0A0N1IMW3_LEPSE|nr:hypothetical protein ABL78_0033 [Leptomonas seymouri]|eukprot:KPI90800.1 hypothetical protein ABL78_0033 [Leptomonas seymouri]
MFEEVDFDDMSAMEANTTLSTPRDTATPYTTLPPAGGGVVQFHKPGDEGFSVVAGACDDADARHDAHFMSGDAWMSKDCHCIQCETIRVMSRFSELHNDPKLSPVIVLMDLDNFGFNQFKSIPPHQDVELLDNVVVWAFFGSCFTRHHRVWPNAQTVCEPLPSRAVALQDTAKRSVWQLLVERGQLFFTPCGGQKQAADSVMHRVIQALHGVDTIFLTGDAKLISEIYRSRRLRGMKSRRSHEDELTDRLTVINVTDLDKRFVPVWRALTQRLRICLRDSGSSSSDDSEEGRLRSCCA